MERMSDEERNNRTENSKHLSWGERVRFSADWDPKALGVKLRQADAQADLFFGPILPLFVIRIYATSPINNMRWPDHGNRVCHGSRAWRLTCGKTNSEDLPHERVVASSLSSCGTRVLCTSSSGGDGLDDYQNRLHDAPRWPRPCLVVVCIKMSR